MEKMNCTASIRTGQLMMTLRNQVRSGVSGPKFDLLCETDASSTSPHMWLADGDPLMRYIARMLRLIAWMF